MDLEDPVTPWEIRGSLFVIADISENVRAIRRLLEEDENGEAEEDDA